MRKLGEVMADLIKKTGMQHTDANFKEILALTTPVSEEAEQGLFSLMNSQEAESWAKGNTNIKKHYTAQAYNGWDDKIFKTADKMGLSDEDKELLRSEKSTGKRQDLLADILDKKIAEAKKNAEVAGKNNNADAELKWKQEFEKLNSSTSKIKDDYELALKKKDDEFYNWKTEAKWNDVLSPQKWSDNLGPNVRIPAAKLVIQNKLNELGAKVVLDEDGELKLVKKEDNSMPYFDSSNKNPKFTEFATKILDENKLLAVSAPTPNQNNNSNNTFKPVLSPSGTAANTNKRPNTVLSALQQSQKDQLGQ
jgi:hypothetical protein